MSDREHNRYIGKMDQLSATYAAFTKLMRQEGKVRHLDGKAYVWVEDVGDMLEGLTPSKP